MKTILFFSTILMTTYLLLACGIIQTDEVIKQEKSIAGNFSKIKISNALNVVVTMGTKESVIVEANEKIISNIEVKQIANELSLRIVNPSFNRNIGLVTIYVNAKNLDNIEVFGASKIKVYPVLKSEKLELKISGASFADIDVDAQQIDTKISGASKVLLKGIAKTCELELSGASKFDASALSTTDYDVDISGASSANIWSLGSINVEISGASSLKYKGNPIMKKMEVLGASSVKKIN